MTTADDVATAAYAIIHRHTTGIAKAQNVEHPELLGAEDFDASVTLEHLDAEAELWEISNRAVAEHCDELLEEDDLDLGIGGFALAVADEWLEAFAGNLAEGIARDLASDGELAAELDLTGFCEHLAAA